MSESKLERNLDKSAIPEAYPETIVPDTVSVEKITIFSLGVALDANIYRPKSLTADDKYPAVVFSHGLGGDKESASRYAVRFADNGVVAVTISHSSWGNSGSNLLLVGDEPEYDENNEGMVKVRRIRNLVDPLHWVQNIRATLDYLEGEPGIDPERLGIWGTSFGGGIVVKVAAEDKRVKALVTQVAAAPVFVGDLGQLAKQRAIDIARGNMDAIPNGIDPIPPYELTLDLAKCLQYDAAKSAESVEAPTLVLVAGEEEMFDNADNSGRIYKALEGRVPCHYEVVPGINHYGVYFEGYEQCSSMALEWFQKHL